MCKSTSAQRSLTRASLPRTPATTVRIGDSRRISFRAVDPGATVTYANNAGDVARRRVENTFNVEKRDYDDKRTIDHAFNERLCEMLGQFSDDVRGEAKGIGNPTFLQVYDLATAEWGYSTPDQRTANLDGITSTTWHPSEGIKTLIRRAKAAIVYSITTGHPIRVTEDRKSVGNTYC